VTSHRIVDKEFLSTLLKICSSNLVCS